VVQNIAKKLNRLRVHQR